MWTASSSDSFIFIWSHKQSILSAASPIIQLDQTNTSSASKQWPRNMRSASNAHEMIEIEWKLIEFRTETNRNASKTTDLLCNLKVYLWKQETWTATNLFVHPQTTFSVSFICNLSVNGGKCIFGVIKLWFY